MHGISSPPNCSTALQKGFNKKKGLACLPRSSSRSRFECDRFAGTLIRLWTKLVIPALGRGRVEGRITLSDGVCPNSGLNLRLSTTCGIIPKQLNSPNRHSYPERRRDRPDDASTTGRRLAEHGAKSGSRSDLLVAYILEDERAAAHSVQLPFRQERAISF